MGIEIRREGSGVDEKGYALAPAVPETARGGVGQKRCIVAVDPRYFRPTDVETLLGDASKARQQLGWEPEISFSQRVVEMMREDLKKAEREVLCRREGFPVRDRNE